MTPLFNFGIWRLSVRPEMTTTPEFAWVEFDCGCGMYLERGGDEHGIWYPPAELMAGTKHQEHARWWREFWDWKHRRERF